jgi:hypothetical protein
LMHVVMRGRALRWPRGNPPEKLEKATHVLEQAEAPCRDWAA